MDATRKQAVIDRNVDRLRREYPERFASLGEQDIRFALGTLIDNPGIADTDADHIPMGAVWQLACLY
ncbi:hypothetical protein [Bifidobacterium thermophilum]|uniref:Uncharacterized protein n=1 Tax=Bifidobacterium thermophilum TaxID=33905 RepID=A0A7X9NQU6_9BIFI|nr:hypothetical protein [Bifidobacterium thermophilum]NME61867.1 hypothetical protein [Bifidobacterium thermophilum]